MLQESEQGTSRESDDGESDISGTTSEDRDVSSPLRQLLSPVRAGTGRGIAVLSTQQQQQLQQQGNSFWSSPLILTPASASACASASASASACASASLSAAAALLESGGISPKRRIAHKAGAGKLLGPAASAAKKGDFRGAGRGGMGTPRAASLGLARTILEEEEGDLVDSETSSEIADAVPRSPLRVFPTSSSMSRVDERTGGGAGGGGGGGLALLSVWAELGSAFSGGQSRQQQQQQQNLHQQQQLQQQQEQQQQLQQQHHQASQQPESHQQSALQAQPLMRMDRQDSAPAHRSSDTSATYGAGMAEPAHVSAIHPLRHSTDGAMGGTGGGARLSPPKAAAPGGGGAAEAGSPRADSVRRAELSESGSGPRSTPGCLCELHPLRKAPAQAAQPQQERQQQHHQQQQQQHHNQQQQQQQHNGGCDDDDYPASPTASPRAADLSPPGSPNATLGGVSSYFCGLPSGCILGRSHPRQVCALCARRVGGSNPVRCPKCRQAVYCNDKCLNRHQPAHSQACAAASPAWVRRGSSRDHEATQTHARSSSQQAPAAASAPAPPISTSSSSSAAAAATAAPSSASSSSSAFSSSFATAAAPTAPPIPAEQRMDTASHLDVASQSDASGLPRVASLDPPATTTAAAVPAPAAAADLSVAAGRYAEHDLVEGGVGPMELVLVVLGGGGGNRGRWQGRGRVDLVGRNGGPGAFSIVLLG
ncbi:unnamed protein product [Closterium sp. NIES-53]